MFKLCNKRMSYFVKQFCTRMHFCCGKVDYWPWEFEPFLIVLKNTAANKTNAKLSFQNE